MPKGGKEKFEELLPPKDKDAELTSAAGMMEDLIQAAGDLNDLRENFYAPLLQKLEADTEITPSRLAAIFDSALEKYAAREEPSDVNYLRERAPELIRALASGQEDLAKETLEVWRQRQNF